MNKYSITLCIGLMLSIQALIADVRLPQIFANGMVLQRNQPIAVWGWADPGEQVKVGLNTQQQETTANADGTWKLTLSAEEAGGPFQLVVSGKNTLTLSDVLIGEVWICSGQSNMQWTVANSDRAEQEIAGANYPQIRQVEIPRKTSGVPLDDVEEPLEWKEANPQNVGNFTAVGYFYARELYKQLNVPIGLINTSWGGTIVETWISKEALEKDKSLKRAVHVFEQVPADTVRKNTDPNHYPTLLFNAMINPLIPYTIKGAIWYQGESNAGRAYEYRKSFPMMIKDWRKRWGLGDFPFYFVQLASFKAAGGISATGSTWAELREAQHMTLSLPHTGEAVTIDIGNTDDIHPRNKQDVGKRLAAIALHDSYGRDVVYSGPVYRKFEINGAQATISFDHVNGGLTTKGADKVVGFEIAGADKHFYPAEARIEGETIVVSSPTVTKPKAVRYAWADDPGKSNLFNEEGFPASPFRTDNWTPATKNAVYELKN
ncbi:9-O-acetylesterase [Parapedobacter defluvii]|uniref:9-O-acetylesterase n=1 Tax=Parapedobacter defluvii TaxID=2045106 RepID=A0ABQ1L107_9SPHI|nr:sialate O-acetylesterase [Parapedobacter defluvii]GGC17027.1 9-O-acetylesterase [Parapedobacter defluvii]